MRHGMRPMRARTLSGAVTGVPTGSYFTTAVSPHPNGWVAQGAVAVAISLPRRTQSAVALQAVCLLGASVSGRGMVLLSF